MQNPIPDLPLSVHSPSSHPFNISTSVLFYEAARRKDMLTGSQNREQIQMWHLLRLSSIVRSLWKANNSTQHSVVFGKQGLLIAQSACFSFYSLLVSTIYWFLFVCFCFSFYLLSIGMESSEALSKSWLR